MRFGFQDICALAATAAFVLSAGCRSHARSAAATTLGDETLIRLHSTSGVGVSLSIDGRIFRAGQPVPAHIAWQDIAATRTLDGDPCNGIQLSFSANTGTYIAAGSPAVPACDIINFRRQTPPLPKGRLLTLDTDLATALRQPLPPGTYQVMASWQPWTLPLSPIGPHGENALPTPYAVARSNIVDITILP